MYAASSPAILCAQWIAWGLIRTVGPWAIPGSRGTIELPEIAEITEALGLGPDGLSMAATYRRRDVRSGETFVATGSAGSLMIKIRQSAAALDLEQRLLAAAAEVRPTTFNVPRPRGSGSLSDGRAWSAQEMVFTAPHRACLELPDGLEDELADVLGRVDGLQPAEELAAEQPVPDELTPAHGDLSPWNLRRDHHGRLWLFDWEDAELAPPGADRAYFQAAAGVIKPGQPVGRLLRPGAIFWERRLADRLAAGHPQGPNTIMRNRLRQALEADLPHGRDDDAGPPKLATLASAREDEHARSEKAPMNRSGQLLSKIASRVKGSSYSLDERIELPDLAHIATDRALMRARAIMALGQRGKTAFLGSRATLRSKHNIHLGRSVTFGDGSLVDALSTDGVWLADNVSIGRNTRIECTGSLRSIGHGIRVGENVGLGTDSFYGCAGGITIGRDTIIGNFVSFHSENHNTERLDIPIRDQGVSHQGITIGRDCWIGAKVTILDGVELGDSCVVAAGSVLTAGTYPGRGIYGGVPARLLKERK